MKTCFKIHPDDFDKRANEEFYEKMVAGGSGGNGPGEGHDLYRRPMDGLPAIRLARVGR